jgi:TonB-linked SusC/RagA family outer membrane protein
MHLYRYPQATLPSGRALIVFIMKGSATTLLLLVLSLQLCFSRSAYSQDLLDQKVSIDVKNEPLAAAFRLLHKKTGLNITYSSKIDVSRTVTFSAHDGKLRGVLTGLLAAENLTYEEVGKNVVIRQKPPVKAAGKASRPAPPAALSIGGVVKDELGNPLVGVSIQVVGTTRGTVTNDKGAFRLEADRGDSLRFSYIGYDSRTIAVGRAATLEITLVAHSGSLNEVVVVGYGEQKKADVTSAVSQIDGDEVRQSPVPSIQNSLSGKLPGLYTAQRSGQPGAASAADIFIRGIATFTGASKQPLVLVDNVEYNLGQLFLIDPNEIKSISILKDAAATAVYGIKGANGVILVTTRRGQVGKPVIHFKTQLGVQTPVHRIRSLGSYQTALLNNEALENDGLADKFTADDLAHFKSGDDPYGHPDVDWNDVLFKRSSLMSNNNLDISGGSERVQYFITLGYLWQNGDLRHIAYKGSDPEAGQSGDINNNYYLKRYKFRSNLDIKATNSLKFQLDIAGTYEEANSPEATGPLSHAFEYEYLNPYIYPVYNPDGSFGYANPNWGNPRDETNNMAGLMALGGYKRDMNDFMDVHLSGVQKLDDIAEGLSIKGEVAYSFANTAKRQLLRSQQFPSFYYDPSDGSYTPRDNTLYRIAPYSLSYTKGTPNRRLNLQGSADYQHSFGSNNVTGLLLFNQTSYYDGANPPVNFRGYTFRFGYNYKEKYLIEISGAYNGSSRFVSQKRYNLFPALSAGYNIAREPFFKDLFPFIESFKIRGSYGWVGNDDIGIAGDNYFYEDSYKRVGTYSFGETDNAVSGIEEDQLGNDDVTWETERKADVGLDFSLFHGKVTGTVDYFNDYRYDILTTRNTIPMYFGVPTGNLPPVNIGRVSNKGFEVELGYRETFGKVGINIKGNVSYARNKILFEDEPPPKYPWQRATGLPIATERQYEWTGTFYQDQTDIDTSAVPAGTVKPGWLKYKDLNGDGIINTDDMAYTGNPNLPNTNIGLTLGASYHGFTISILLQAAVNFDVYAGFDMAVPFKTVLQPIHLNRWTPETAKTATFPALTTNFAGTYMSPNGNPSTFWSVPGDYLRFRTAYVSYTFPVNMVNHIGLKGLQVFANGYDLFTRSKMLHKYQFDPEVSQGSDHYVYPTQRIINFGLNLTF